MRTFEYILFDCMETLVDLHKLPAHRDYAAWAFSGSGVEEYWPDFDEFFRYYLLSMQELKSRPPEHSEQDLTERFLHIVQISFPDHPHQWEPVTEKLCENYWRNYKAGSYVREDVLNALEALSYSYRMGVVSNFMVMDGIEELLEKHGIRQYFDFVVTSVKEGWRKPHRAIYDKALSLAGVSPEKVLFVGDDYVNDFVTPKEIGMTPVYLDRYNRHPELVNRAGDFDELLKRIMG